MLSRSIRQFNLLCLALCAMFFVGIFFQWRAMFVQAYEPVPIVIPAPVEIIRNVQDDEDVELVTEERIVESGAPDTEESKQSNSTSTTISTESGRLVVDRMSESSDGVAGLVLPKRINLPVPFTSQAPEENWDQPWQDACEEAVVLMLDAYYKGYGVSPLFAKDEILKMVAWEEEKAWGMSIEIAKVQALMKWYAGNQLVTEGKQVVVIENPTVESIKTSIANGHPVLAVARGKDLPNPYFSGDGPDYHALIIRGYTEDSFITNDPGTRLGENFVYTYEDLMNAIRDWNGGDVASGRRVVMMVR